MAFVLMEIRRAGKAPTVEEIRAEYGLAAAELDASYGVVLVDPRDGTYAIMVEESAAAKLGRSGTGSPGPDGTKSETRGPYSNPRIESTGPPRPRRTDS
jgi:hypothetical protein